MKGNLFRINNNPYLRNMVKGIPVPRHLSRNFHDDFCNEPDDINSIGSKNHSDYRLDYFRKTLIPWIDSVKRLQGLRILEIGCGTGSSTVAFAEQGAMVTAIDIDEPILSTAKERCQNKGLEVEFILLNAAEIKQNLANKTFDLVIFMASLEHMTFEERIQSLRSGYEILPPKGLFCIAGSPNRLHFMDSHTSLIPFFHWLPDELAIQYSVNSSRMEYKVHMADIIHNNENMEPFYRWGRGISFHEIELAIKPLQEIRIISDLYSYIRKKNFTYSILCRFTSNFRYERLLSKLFPDYHPCFFRPYLDVIMEKEE